MLKAKPYPTAIWRQAVPALLLALSLALAACGRPAIYDPALKAEAALARAQTESAASGRPVLLLFGADWCGDCKALERAMRRRDTAEWLAANLLVVKVDVGNFDRNGELLARFGNPAAGGIPAAVLLDPSGEVRYATRRGELATARQQTSAGILDFFRRISGRP